MSTQSRVSGCRGLYVSVGEGEVVFGLQSGRIDLNPIGIVHGGLLCTLLDFAAGAAVQSVLEPGVASSSIDIKVSYLKPLRADSGPIEAHGHALRVGQQIAFAEARARDQNGVLVGQATTSLAVTRRTL